MKITLDRQPSTPDGTLGMVSIDGVFLCYSLEPSETRALFPAIPAGTYRVLITTSNRFKRRLPLILVPGRSGIRVHPGNFDDDTEGCVLLGTGKRGCEVVNSRVACDMFQSRIALPLAKGEDVMITLTDAAAPVVT